ncbi:hypothetical protein [Streptacidiphilus sp. EB129]|uniref:hypothetical protein n=1 Tax=Streptacidiphilus sp. EB129 TaxID=3156262 RepID=UPI0035127B36
MLMILTMAAHHVRYRAQRVTVAREQRDRGALSIELALLVIVLIFAAGVVVLAITNLVKSKAGQIGGGGGGATGGTAGATAGGSTGGTTP